MSAPDVELNEEARRIACEWTGDVREDEDRLYCAITALMDIAYARGRRAGLEEAAQVVESDVANWESDAACALRGRARELRALKETKWGEEPKP